MKKVPVGSSLEISTRRTLRRIVQELHSAAQEAVHQRAEINASSARMEELQGERRGMALPGADNTATFIILILGIIAVYWIDYLLFGSVAEYFAQKTFGSNSWIAKIAPIAGPFLIITIELVIATQIYLARERIKDLEGSAWSYRGWLFTGLVLAIVMPSAAVAMNLATFQSFTELPPALKVLQITTVAIAFVSHIGILFGGKSAHEAKDWTRNRFQVWRQRRKGMRAFSRRTKAVSLVLDMFQMYRDKVITAISAEIPVLPGAIDTVVRALLKEEFSPRDPVEELDAMISGSMGIPPSLLIASAGADGDLGSKPRSDGQPLKVVGVAQSEEPLTEIPRDTMN